MNDFMWILLGMGLGLGIYSFGRAVEAARQMDAKAAGVKAPSVMDKIRSMKFSGREKGFLAAEIALFVLLIILFSELRASEQRVADLEHVCAGGAQ